MRLIFAAVFGGVATIADFVLVHGSFHGPWCWSRLTPRLEALGHRVVVPDLASGGEAQPDLDDYARMVAAAIDRMPGPVVLVGHSMGGLVASQAGEMRAERLQTIVYVAGLLLRNGETLFDFTAAHAGLGVEDLVLKSMRVSEDGTLATFPAEAAPGIFYNRCSPADAAWASAQLRPQPTAVYGTPVRQTQARLGRVPAYYIETLQDRAVSPLYQRQMTARSPCREVVALDTDHSPFLSCPEELAAVLVGVAGA